MIVINQSEVCDFNYFPLVAQSKQKHTICGNITSKISI